LIRSLTRENLLAKEIDFSNNVKGASEVLFYVAVGKIKHVWLLVYVHNGV